jgi:hypothetical protein
MASIRLLDVCFAKDEDQVGEDLEYSNLEMRSSNSNVSTRCVTFPDIASFHTFLDRYQPNVLWIMNIVHLPSIVPEYVKWIISVEEIPTSFIKSHPTIHMACLYRILMHGFIELLHMGIDVARAIELAVYYCYIKEDIDPMDIPKVRFYNIDHVRIIDGGIELPKTESKPICTWQDTEDAKFTIINKHRRCIYIDFGKYASTAPTDEAEIGLDGIYGLKNLTVKLSPTDMEIFHMKVIKGGILHIE